MWSRSNVAILMFYSTAILKFYNVLCTIMHGRTITEHGQDQCNRSIENLCLVRKS